MMIARAIHSVDCASSAGSYCVRAFTYTLWWRSRSIAALAVSAASLSVLLTFRLIFIPAVAAIAVMQVRPPPDLVAVVAVAVLFAVPE